jgi:hypothetical protein
MNAHQSAYLMLMTGIPLANLTVALSKTPMRNFVTWLLGYAVWMLSSRLIAMDGTPTVDVPWELVATSFAFFGVLAFPTIVWRYFYRH